VATVIDVGGDVIAPGFVDMHSHSDFALPLDDHGPLLAPFLEQGVTTVVGGNCGLSPAPVEPGGRARLESFASMTIDRPFEWTWRGMGELLDAFDRRRPAVNVAQLVGHAAIRYAAAASPRGMMSGDEQRTAVDLTRRALDDGACGVSFGLGYDPGMYSPQEELVALSRAAAAAGKVVTVHLKAFSRISPCYPLTEWRPHNLRALREMLEVGRQSGARLQLSHFIFVGRRTWSTAPTALGLVDRARANGLDVAIDAFPYTCGNTTILAPVPYWFLARLPEAFHSRAARARLRLELEVGFALVGFDYDDFQVMEIAVPEWRELEGLTVAQIAHRWRSSKFDAFLRIAERSRGAALILFHGYSGDRDGRGPIEAVLSHEACLFETDAIARTTGWPNPATLGTFPRVLGTYVRERRAFGLEHAVRRMTSASAARFGITDRGVLAPGKAADVVVFDAAAVADRPGGDGKPAGRPAGIRQVFVNGAQAVCGGAYDPAVRAGRVLRR
jgi:N-acyl-D-amino-acid deacylase